MKKITLLAAALTLSLASCSSDDSGNPVDGGSQDPLVKTVFYNDQDDDFDSTVEYTYNGNKIVQGVYDDGTLENYTYSGDLITKIEFVEGGQVTYRETFTYDGSGRLIQYLDEDLVDDWEDLETFVYNSDGTVTSTYDGLVSTIHLQNDEVAQVIQNTGHIYNYSYDGKNSPFKNVTGWDKIANVVQGDHEFFGRHQNITLIHETTEDVDYMVNTMTYNSANYPTSVTSVAEFEFEGTYTATVQYTYY